MSPPPASLPPLLHPLLGRLLAELRWHRRSIAAALLLLAVLLSVRAVLAPRPAAVAVLVADRTLAAGATLSGHDLRVAAFPPELVPDGAVDPGAPPWGRVVALPLAKGTPITEPALLGTSLLASIGGDVVAAPLRLADGAAVGVVAPGDRVDVLAAGETGAGQVVASDARVLVPPRDPREPVVVVAVTSSASRSLARAAAIARLSLVIRGP